MLRRLSVGIFRQTGLPPPTHGTSGRHLRVCSAVIGVLKIGISGILC